MKNNHLAVFKIYEIVKYLFFFKKKRLVTERSESYYATQRYAKWLATTAAKEGGYSGNNPAQPRRWNHLPKENCRWMCEWVEVNIVETKWRPNKKTVQSKNTLNR